MIWIIVVIAAAVICAAAVVATRCRFARSAAGGAGELNGLLAAPAVTAVLRVRSRTYISVSTDDVGDAATKSLRAAAETAGVDLVVRRRGQLLLSDPPAFAKLTDQLRSAKSHSRAVPLRQQAAAAAASDDPQVREFVADLPRAQRRALANANRKKGRPARTQLSRSSSSS